MVVGSVVITIILLHIYLYVVSIWLRIWIRAMQKLREYFFGFQFSLFNFYCFWRSYIVIWILKIDVYLWIGYWTTKSIKSVSIAVFWKAKELPRIYCWNRVNELLDPPTAVIDVLHALLRWFTHFDALSVAAFEPPSGYNTISKHTLLLEIWKYILNLAALTWMWVQQTYELIT